MLSFSIIDFSWSASVWITWQLELSKLMKIKILHKYQINSNYTQFTAIIICTWNKVHLQVIKEALNHSWPNTYHQSSSN